MFGFERKGNDRGLDGIGRWKFPSHRFITSWNEKQRVAGKNQFNSRDVVRASLGAQREIRVNTLVTRRRICFNGLD